MTQIAYSDFPSSTWDGLCYQYDSLLTDSDPSFFWQDKATVEIQAIEDYLISFSDTFDFFGTLGAANSFVGVKADQSDLTYRTFVAGTGISIVHTDTTTTITATSAAGELTANLTNVDSVQVVKGTPVYSFSSGGFKRGKADAAGTIHLVGLAYVDISSSTLGAIQTDGVVAATTGEWDVVTGGSGGLTINTTYYLSEATIGELTSTPPSTGYIVPVGLALSTTQLKLNILTPVLL